jgi:hypothetical protein
MTRYLLLHALSLLVLCGCATSGGTVETVEFPFRSSGVPPKFVESFDIIPRQVGVTRFVWEGESIDDWTEAVEIVNTWRKNNPATPKEALETLVEKRIAQCPEATHRLLHQDESSVLYELITINCPPHPDEHSITRLIYGRNEVFTVIYTNKVNPLSPSLRDEWIDILSRANRKEVGRSAQRGMTPLRGTH